MSENGCDDDYSQRDRSPMRDDGSDDEGRRNGDRRGGSGRRGGGGGGGRRAPAERRVYVSNITYEMKWQDIKDLFVKEVGEVTYVNLFKDERGKARGCGIIEFADEQTARDAVEKMHRYKLNGRELVVKEDTDRERDRYGFIIKDGGNRGGSSMQSRTNDDFRPSIGSSRSDPSSKFGNTYGLNIQFLHSLGIDGPLVSRVFVANLDYKVDEKKLKEVFKLAGKVSSTEIHKDKEGNSRGYGIVDFEHPVEAVQAISMFKDQMLFDRKMAVRMDSAAMREEKEGIPNKLPVGLKGIGMGLGSGGAPLKNVSGTVNSGSGSSNANIATNAISGLVGAGGLAGAGLGGLGLAGAAQLGALGGLGAAGLGAAAGLGGGAVGLGATGLGSLGAAAAAPAGLGVAAGLQANSNLLGSHTSGANFNLQNVGGGFSSSDNRGFSGGDNRGFTGSDNRRNTSSSNTRNDTIIVRNLPHHFTYTHLRERFRDIGDVLYTEIRDKGVGIVRFGSEKDAQRAIHLMDRSRLEGQTIDVYAY